MTGCLAPNGTDVRRLDETVERLVPHVATLLGSLAEGDVRTQREGNVHVLSVPLRFPDGIGHGAVVARVFRYRTSARVDLEIVHDRVMAAANGTPTAHPCFLNDFVASVSLGVDAEELPPEFVRSVRVGVRDAVMAVETHNQRHPQPWGRIEVVAA
jgi:hypothetical protein